MKTNNSLISKERAKELIEQERVLIFAGDERLLQSLPKGNWIGGTIPYFMGDKGGCFSVNELFVNDMTDIFKSYKIQTYDASTIQNVVIDSFENGFTYLLIPGQSDVLLKFALISEKIDSIYKNPLTGWITGINLDEIGKISPKVFDGRNITKSDSLAVAIHIQLPENKIANLEIINIFTQGDGDIITVNEDGFAFDHCLINNQEQNLADYFINNKVDVRFPLVADYSGAMINVSVQQVDKINKKVNFYAPLKKGVKYKLAKPISNYVNSFEERIPDDAVNIVSSFNCILNYLYSELEGKKTGHIKGPFTFGEIAFVLLNQTMVYLSVLDS